MTINELAEKLSQKELELSHIAVQTDGKVLYQVNDLLMSLEDANNVAEGLTTLEDVQRRNAHRAPIGSITAVAAVIQGTKALFDVTRDGWESLKPSPNLQIDIVNVKSEPRQYVVEVHILNLSRSGIYLESVSLAPRSIRSEDKLSISQPTLLLSRPRGLKGIDFPSKEVREAEENEPRISCLPIYLRPQFIDVRRGPEVFDMELPRSYRDHEPHSYAVAELEFSKLDEPTPGKASFTFRLRESSALTG
jgi:hypothetical protein